jgi:hypothetical protein
LIQPLRKDAVTSLIAIFLVQLMMNGSFVIGPLDYPDGYFCLNAEGAD